MAIISNGTTVASGGNLEASRLTGTASAFNGSNITNLPSSAPTTSQVASATASISANAVGSYAFLKNNYNNQTKDGGSTLAGSYCAYADASGSHEPYTNRSGTWRSMGRTQGNNNAGRTTVMLRIS